jgi:hypothetical protein
LSARPTLVVFAPRVNHGRWIVDCLTPFCSGAVRVHHSETRATCSLCDNAERGPLPIAWPDERGQIENVLLKRPAPQTRNWSYPETVEDLQKENAEHGVD